ncbi:hypothetical protein [Streptomyces yaizuensis]|uniref:Uncharacterized protein n=1 Tax=Streptomyces yaizuensis TaxID=2989713 RepID=A0ABQ5P1T1_9ACTN|nr:hypothetical protein [Streptomyces sp. YSPA8]GLF96568.1 hypothetical protein SYYSPA8_19745 [Streptomyces sp. YSPA8]
MFESSVVRAAGKTGAVLVVMSAVVMGTAICIPSSATAVPSAAENRPVAGDDGNGTPAAADGFA